MLVSNNPWLTWVCLKMWLVSHCTQWLYNDHYPYEKWLAIIGKINPIFRETHIIRVSISVCADHLLPSDGDSASTARKGTF